MGGTEKVVEELARRFARSGHDVTVATSDEPGAPAEEMRDGYRVRRFRLLRAGPLRVPPHAYRRFVAREDWDVVHLHGARVWSTDHLYPVLRRARAPFVFTAHGLYGVHVDPHPMLGEWYYRLVLPRAMRSAAAVTALTQAEAHELEFFGIPGARVIPDGIDPGEFASPAGGFRARHGLPQDGPLLLYVGGFYRNKRVDRLVKLAARTRVPLVVVGKEHDVEHGRAACERVARERGARLHVLGALPREDVLAAYRECTLFVLGSDFEGFGLVLLEAMASGLPFVSTPVGAAPDLAQHGAGRVAASVVGMAQAVEALLEDDAAWRSASAAGRAAAPAYSWDAVARSYLALYEEVVA